METAFQILRNAQIIQLFGTILLGMNYFIFQNSLLTVIIVGIYIAELYVNYIALKNIVDVLYTQKYLSYSFLGFLVVSFVSRIFIGIVIFLEFIRNEDVEGTYGVILYTVIGISSILFGLIVYSIDKNSVLLTDATFIKLCRLLYVTLLPIVGIFSILYGSFYHLISGINIITAIFVFIIFCKSIILPISGYGYFNKLNLAIDIDTEE